MDVCASPGCLQARAEKRAARGRRKAAGSARNSGPGDGEERKPAGTTLHAFFARAGGGGSEKSLAPSPLRRQDLRADEMESAVLIEDEASEEEVVVGGGRAGERGGGDNLLARWKRRRVEEEEKEEGEEGDFERDTCGGAKRAKTKECEVIEVGSESDTEVIDVD